MGIPNEDLKSITDKYIDETEENLEIELAEFFTEGWAINDKETAIRIDFLIHKLEEKITEDENIADIQKQVLQTKIDKLEEGKTKLDEWLHRSTKPHRERIADLKVHLHLFHKRVVESEERENEKRIAEGKKPLKVSKSIKLTYRDLTSKQQVPEVVKNDDELTKWVVENHSGLISLDELTELLENKKANEQDTISVNELLDIINSNDSEYVKRDIKLSWSEFKKTLTQQEIAVKDFVDEIEVVVGKKLVYFDQNGQEVPHVQLIERGASYDWKLNS